MYPESRTVPSAQIHLRSGVKPADEAFAAFRVKAQFEDRDPAWQSRFNHAFVDFLAHECYLERKSNPSISTSGETNAPIDAVSTVSLLYVYHRVR